MSAVGSAFPLHCTANGKALLSGLDDDAIRDLLPAQLTRFTAATITSRDALLAELDEIRRSGVAFDREEHTDGISAVAAVVRDAHGPVAAISVPVPTQRFTGNEDRYAGAVRAAAGRAVGADRRRAAQPLMPAAVPGSSAGEPSCSGITSTMW